jgi:hypothetical protein
VAERPISAGTKRPHIGINMPKKAFHHKIQLIQNFLPLNIKKYLAAASSKTGSTIYWHYKNLLLAPKKMQNCPINGSKHSNFP